MDNIIIEKKWSDEGIIEIKINAETEYINVWQECYVSESCWENNTERIIAYLKNPQGECYVVYGNMSGNYTPAFSMFFSSIDVRGHIRIEMDIEINDNNVRAHRCSFYIITEMGLLENFAQKMLKLLKADVGFRIMLDEKK